MQPRIMTLGSYLLVMVAAVIVSGCKKKPESAAAVRARPAVSSEVIHIAGLPADAVNEPVTAADNIVDVQPAVTPNTLPAVPDFFPAPPSGFSWLYVEEISTGILLPENWHWKKVMTSDDPACFISKESFDQNGIFKTGLSLYVLQDVFRRTGLSVNDYAKTYIETACQKGQVSEIWEQQLGPFYEYGCLLRDFTGFDENTMMRHFLLTHRETGSLYLIIFESPESTWEQAWPVGRVIVYSSMYNTKI